VVTLLGAGSAAIGACSDGSSPPRTSPDAVAIDGVLPILDAGIDAPDDLTDTQIADAQVDTQIVDARADAQIADAPIDAPAPDAAPDASIDAPPPIDAAPDAMA